MKIQLILYKFLKISKLYLFISLIIISRIKINVIIYIITFRYITSITRKKISDV